MGKKKENRNKPTQIHPTKLFVEKVVEQVLVGNLNTLGQRLHMALRQEMFQVLMNTSIEMQTAKRILKQAHETTAPGTFDELFRSTKFDIEDESKKLTTSLEPTEVGDYVRIETQSRVMDDKGKEIDKYNDQKQFIAIPKLSMENNQKQYVLGKKDLEDQLLGLKAGESKELIMTTPELVTDDKGNVKIEDGKKVTEIVVHHYLATIYRVSKYPVTEKSKVTMLKNDKAVKANKK